VFSSANAIRKYTMRELVELGIAWVWMGLESPQASYAKLKDTDTIALTQTLRSHGIRVQGSTIVGMEHHTPDNLVGEIEHAVTHEADFHQFMLYTPVPGTALHAEMEASGRMLPNIDLADIHGQYKFNFRHEHIERDASKNWLDYAFQRDFEVNGPSLFRMMRTMFEGWRRYGRDADPRVRARVAQDARKLQFGYGAALWAMERYLPASSAVAAKVRALRLDIEREFGLLTRLTARTLGPFLLSRTRAEAARYPGGRPLEPQTFVDRRNWV